MEVSGESPGRLFGRLVPPDARAGGPGYLVSLALAIASYCLRHLHGVQLPLSLWFITPLAGLVFLENFAIGGVDSVFGSGF